METDKFGYVRFRFRCISVSRHHDLGVGIATVNKETRWKLMHESEC